MHYQFTEARGSLNPLEFKKHAAKTLFEENFSMGIFSNIFPQAWIFIFERARPFSF